MTPATIELEKGGHAFRILEYEVNPDAGDYGPEAARVLGISGAEVFKTLLADLADGETVVAIVPVVSMLDLKRLAAAAGAKRAVMSAPDLAERRTGYPVGGISPFGQRQRHRTFLDETALEHGEIYVSGGRRGLELAIDPSVVLSVLDASSAALTRP